jgi:hypothetical protein
MGSLPQPTELDRHALEKFRELLANINKEAGTIYIEPMLSSRLTTDRFIQTRN